MENQIIPNCPVCGEMMDLKTKGEDRFWGCRNWKTKGCKTLPFKGEYPKQKPQDVKGVTGDLLIIDELKAINDRLDKLADFLKGKYDKG